MTTDTRTEAQRNARLATETEAQREQRVAHELVPRSLAEKQIAEDHQARADHTEQPPDTVIEAEIYAREALKPNLPQSP